MNEVMGPSITPYAKVQVDYAIRPSNDFSKSFGWVSDGYRKGTDWRRDERCTNVPTEGRVQLDFELVHFNKVMKTKEVLEALDFKGLRPATLEELVSFSRHHPELPLELWIVSLGSACVWVGKHLVPCLSKCCHERRLYLSWDEPDCSWDESSGFLAVRK